MFTTKGCSNSTGEPPTEAKSENPTYPRRHSVTFTEPMSVESEPGQDAQGSLPASKRTYQEADSGYEASPSSNRGSYGFSFDSNSSEACSFSSNPSRNEPSRKESSTASGAYHSRNTDDEESSAVPVDLTDIAYSSGDDDVDVFLTGRSAPEHDDLIDDDNDGGAGAKDINRSPRGNRAEGRPTSLPIPVPVPEISSSRRSVNFGDLRGQAVCASSLPTGAATMRMDPVVPARTSTLYPLSWPGFRPFVTWWLRPLSLTSDGNVSSPSYGEGTSRRKIFDSDTYSISSSENDDQEDVFEENEEVIADVPVDVPVVSSAPTANGHLFTLSDVSSSHSVSWNDVRRSRSVSVSLPLERDLQQACYDVGQTLRRLSDQFSTQVTLRHQAPRGRRNTVGVSDCTRLSVRMNQNRRDQDRDPDNSPPGSSRPNTSNHCQSEERPS